MNMHIFYEYIWKSVYYSRPMLISSNRRPFTVTVYGDRDAEINNRNNRSLATSVLVYKAKYMFITNFIYKE